MTITIIIIVITSIFSILAFKQTSLIYRYQLNPVQIFDRHQYARLFLHAFLHANWTHLLINMLVLYSFGEALESYLQLNFGSRWIPYFLLFYFGAILISPIYSLVRNRKNYNYNAIGASGAVSAIVFATVFFNPWSNIYLFALVPVPGIVFAILYLIYSWIMSRKSQDNIAHDTHFFGAIYGFLLPIILNPELLAQFIRMLTKSN
ncbi:MAG: rhomboid family intramembrane serine protease [Bacteroidales bacterium]|jgi:membrane associated rhomboid family serine protease|nr:rhomboid family intramembrane serine protease [Bacteroidales bacterium]NLO67027.1 rhomboid family intramembrane serine protease [Bacteroidales bacterium]